MTTRQATATDIIMKSGGKVSVGKAMIQAGYSKATANRPEVLTKSKAYIEAMAKIRAKHGVTLDKYVRNIGQAMEATTTVSDGFTTNDDGKAIPAFKEVPNHLVRLSANKQAEKILQIDKHFGGSSSEELAPADLEALASESDEIELTKLLFRRNS